MLYKMLVKIYEWKHLKTLDEGNQNNRKLEESLDSMEHAIKIERKPLCVGRTFGTFCLVGVCNLKCKFNIFPGFVFCL